MEEMDIPSTVYAFETDKRKDIAVKQAKKKFAEEYDYPYEHLKGKSLSMIPAYGIRVYVCYEPPLFNDRL